MQLNIKTKDICTGSDRMPTKTKVQDGSKQKLSARIWAKLEGKGNSTRRLCF
jgi:hypothetical protein